MGNQLLSLGVYNWMNVPQSVRFAEDRKSVHPDDSWHESKWPSHNHMSVTVMEVLQILLPSTGRIQSQGLDSRTCGSSCDVSFKPSMLGISWLVVCQPVNSVELKLKCWGVGFSGAEKKGEALSLAFLGIFLKRILGICWQLREVCPKTNVSQPSSTGLGVWPRA